MSPALGAVVLALGAGAWPVEPEVGLGVALRPQALTVSGAAGGTSLRPPSGVGEVAVGVAYRPWAAPVLLRTSLGVGLGSLDLHVQLSVQQQALYRLELLPWLALEAGLWASASLDATDPAFSAACLGVALGVQLWRFEVAWAPALQLPLGRSERTAGEVTVTQAMATALVPVSFSLRVALGPG
jgi:hypothetical protein